MAKQLVYTSAPQGIWPGATGYCTVLSTEGISRSLAEFLEKTSVYRITDRQHGNLIPSTPEQYDRLLALNPSNLAHFQFNLRGKESSVLAKTCLAGFDYSNRLRKLSHFLVLDEHDKAQAGPGWLASQTNIFLGNWGAKPTLLTEDKQLPTGAVAAAACVTWKAIAGDAGYAGQLAVSITDRSRPVYIVVDNDMDVLALLQEAIALLPPNRRWEVTFATRYFSLPQGVLCQWRFVRKDSTEHHDAVQVSNKLLIDLTSPLPVLPGSPEVESARTGTTIDLPKPTGGERTTLWEPDQPFVLTPPLSTFSPSPTTPGSLTNFSGDAPASGSRAVNLSAPWQTSPPIPEPPAALSSPPPPPPSRLREDNRLGETDAPAKSFLSGRFLALFVGIGMVSISAVVAAIVSVVVFRNLQVEPTVAKDDQHPQGKAASNLLANDLPKDGLRIEKIKKPNGEEIPVTDKGATLDLEYGRVTVQSNGTCHYEPKKGAPKPNKNEEEQFSYLPVGKQANNSKSKWAKVQIPVSASHVPPTVAKEKNHTLSIANNFGNKEKKYKDFKEFKNHLREFIDSGRQNEFFIEIDLGPMVDDSDDDKATLTYELLAPRPTIPPQAAKHGALKSLGNGVFEYYPDFVSMIGREDGQDVDDQLKFKVTDSGGLSCELPVTIRVPGVNFGVLMPRKELEWKVREGSKKGPFGFENLRANISNPERRNFTETFDGQNPGISNSNGFNTPKGRVEFLDNKQFRYIPNQNAGQVIESIEDGFTYSVTNGIDGTSECHVRIIYRQPKALTNEQLKTALDTLADQMANLVNIYEYEPGKKLRYCELPDSEVWILGGIEIAFVQQLKLELVQTTTSLPSFPQLSIEHTDAHEKWKLLRQEKDKPPEVVAEFIADDEVFMFRWATPLPDVKKSVRELAQVSLLKLSANSGDGQKHEHTVQFFAPVALESKKPIKFAEFKRETAQGVAPDSLESESTAKNAESPKDTTYDLLPLELLPTKIAELLQKSDQPKLVMTPPEIEAESVTVEKQWKIKTEELNNILPKCTLQPWQPKKPIQLLLTVTKEALANELTAKMLASPKGKKPLTKDVPDLLREIGNAIKYPRNMHVLLEVNHHHFLLAFPKK